MKHDNNFDLLRLLAACQVVATHSIEFLKVPFPGIHYLLLFPGVPIFFVISGFLITGSYIDGNRNILKYTRSRCLRIYPALWVNLVFIALLCLCTNNMAINDNNWNHFFGFFGILAITASTYIAQHVVIVQSFSWYGPPILVAFPGGVLWTIVVELGFYLLVPIIFHTRWREWQIAIYFATSFAVALALPFINSPALLTSVAPYLWIFLIGAACRLAWDRVRFLFVNTFPLWLAAHVAIGVSPDFNIHPTVWTLLTIFPLAGCVLSFAHTMPQLARQLRGRDISYGIYLYHAPVVLTLQMLGYTESATVWGIVVAITFTLSSVSWFAVERPCLRLKNLGRDRPKGLPGSGTPPSCTNPPPVPAGSGGRVANLVTDPISS